MVTAALFSLAHAPPDLQTFLYRFAIGLALSAAVWLTGGLEASIVLHAVNNVVIFLLAGALGDRAGVAAEPGLASSAGADQRCVGILGMAARSSARVAAGAPGGPAGRPELPESPAPWTCARQPSPAPGRTPWAAGRGARRGPSADQGAPRTAPAGA